MTASLLLTLAKAAVGWTTGSLALLSEAGHSLIDFGATVMTYAAVRISGKPAAEEVRRWAEELEGAAPCDSSAELSAGSPGADQNKKYRCASGSTVAGSQVRSSPSARTSYVCESTSITGVAPL